MDYVAARDGRRGLTFKTRVKDIKSVQSCYFHLAVSASILNPSL